MQSIADLFPVLSLPPSTRFQTARLSTVWPECVATAMRLGAIHQALSDTFITAGRTLRETKRTQKGEFSFSKILIKSLLTVSVSVTQETPCGKKYPQCHTVQATSSSRTEITVACDENSRNGTVVTKI